MLMDVKLKDTTVKKRTNRDHKILDANALKYDVVRKKYHDELMKFQHDEGLDLDQSYDKLTKIMKISASKALKSSKEPLTPKTKNALNRLNKALHCVLIPRFHALFE